MPVLNKELSLPYRPEQMFELVSDIERYPEFVPWVAALRIIDPNSNGSILTCTGEALVAFKGFTQTFATHVRSDSEALTVNVSLARGPLKRLENSWRFTSEKAAGCKLNFTVDYEFSNFLFRAIAKANHELAVSKIMGTFLSEAKRRYDTTS